MDVFGVNTPAVAPTVNGVPEPDKVTTPLPALNSVLFAIAKTLEAPVVVIVGLFVEPSTTAVVWVPSPQVILPDTVNVPEPKVCVTPLAPGLTPRFTKVAEATMAAVVPVKFVFVGAVKVPPSTQSGSVVPGVGVLEQAVVPGPTKVKVSVTPV